MHFNHTKLNNPPYLHFSVTFVKIDDFNSNFKQIYCFGKYLKAVNFNDELDANYER